MSDRHAFRLTIGVGLILFGGLLAYGASSQEYGAKGFCAIGGFGLGAMYAAWDAVRDRWQRP